MANPDSDRHARAVQGMFTRIAGRYDLVNRWMTAGQDQRWRREVNAGGEKVLLQPGAAQQQLEVVALGDPTAHAEIQALRQAARAVGNYRLIGATLYVTIEPCLMCVGAMVHARVGTLVFGATEPKSGAVVSSCRAHELPSLNHRVEVVGGVLEEDCRAIIQEFFKTRRR